MFIQSGTDLAVPLRSDQGRDWEVPEREHCMEPGGAQELRLLGLRRAKVPHTVTEPEDRQVCLLTGFTIFENYLYNATSIKPKLINDLGPE